MSHNTLLTHILDNDDYATSNHQEQLVKPDWTEQFARAQQHGYVLVGEIATGHFGRVSKGVHKATGCLVAIKHLQLDVYKGQYKYIKTEMSVLSSLSHPNICKYLMSYGLDGDPCPTSLVFEYLPLDLQKHLSEQPEQRLAEKEARVVFGDVISALHYCHVMGVAHRDIKPGNILLTYKGRAKITDFGIALDCRANKHALDHVSGWAGTRNYMAPEIWCRQSYYSAPAADVWSAGVVLYQMLLGQLPFSHPADTLRGMHLGKLRSMQTYLSYEVQDLLCSILKPETARLTTDAILWHLWLMDYVPLQTYTANLNARQMALKRVLRLYPSLSTDGHVFDQLNQFNQYSTTFKLLTSGYEEKSQPEAPGDVILEMPASGEPECLATGSQQKPYYDSGVFVMDMDDYEKLDDHVEEKNDEAWFSSWFCCCAPVWHIFTHRR